MKKIVHIGQMKSGTTYIQNALSYNRQTLEKAGFIYPGQLINQQHACYGLCGENISWVASSKKWESLALEMLDEIKASSRDVLISAEALSCMDEDGVDHFVDKLGGVDEVVVTVRNYHRMILSAWQQSIKGGGVKSLSEFIEYIRSRRLENKGMWKNYRFGDTVKLWAAYAKVNIVVVGGEEGLLAKFSKASGIPAIAENEVESVSSNENKSLKREDVELLRRFNAMNRGMDKKKQSEYLRWLLREGLFPAAELPSGSKIKLPGEWVEEITSWAKVELSKVADDVSVFGDLNSVCEVDKTYVDDGCSNAYFDDSYLSRANYIMSLIYENSNR